MKTVVKELTLYVCGCCKRSLPFEDFYINGKTGLPGNYCKECRKSTSRQHREAEKNTFAHKKPGGYLIITLVEDPEVRNELILHALRVVAESIERKRRRVIRENYDSED